jgi:hypothetical protein
MELFLRVQGYELNLSDSEWGVVMGTCEQMECSWKGEALLV